MLSGDLLFAGSIGRTDLPGGDHAAMLESLSRVVLTQPDEMVVLPGHGQTTTIGAERRSNPFLRDLVPPSRSAAGR
jgi:hydroxyacylglutathione hydrolase